MSVEDLKDEFETFGIDVDDDFVIEKLQELCTLHQIDADTIVVEWVAFAKSRKDVPISIDSLDQFDREKLSKRTQKTPKTPVNKLKNRAIYDVTNIQDGIDENNVENLYNVYSSTPSAKVSATQKRQLTPENPPLKRFTNNIRSPAVPFSPASFSPAGSTPSKKYSSRTNANQVLASHGASDNTKWQGQGQSCSIQLCKPDVLQSEENESVKDITREFKYMFQKMAEKANVLNCMIDDMSAQLQNEYSIEEVSHVSLPAQEPVTVVGRICCDSVGKLNAKSVLLEGSRNTSAGRCIPLDLSELKQYSLFPGQVVAMDGTNITGQKFVANKLYEGVPLPLPDVPENTGECNLSLLIAAGPFTTSDNLSYEPLADLVKHIRNSRPDVCILMGPFVDVKNEIIDEGKCAAATYNEIFETRLKEINNEARSTGCRVILMPSHRDVHHDSVYPQPPYDHWFQDKERDAFKHIHFMPDPCTFTINNVTFGVTSTDILFHLGGEEISFNTQGSSDRIGRLAQHLLTQQSFYPLHPPSEDISMDYETFDLYGKMQKTPHVLILPSDLKQFIKDIKGTCCINPGRLTKGQVGGTFARMIIRSTKVTSNTSLVPSITAQVLRI